MILSKESKKLIEEIINQLNEDIIIFDYVKKDIIIKNKRLLNSEWDKKCSNEDSIQLLLKKVYSQKVVYNSYFQIEYECNITKQNKCFLLKIVPINFGNLHIIRLTDVFCKQTDNLINILSKRIDHNNQLIAVINTKAEFEYVNIPFSQTFEMKKEAIIGTSLFSFSTLSSKFQNIRIWKTLSEGHIWEGEISTFKPSGEEVFLKSSIVPIKSNGKEIDKFIVLADNVTQKKQIEKELKTIEKQKHILLKSLPDTLFIIDNKGVIKDYKKEKNEKMCHTEHVIDKTISEVLLYKDLAKKITNNIRFCFKTQKIKQFNVEIKNDLVLECRMMAQNDDEIICILRNISKRVAAERLLKNREKSYKSMVENFPSGIIIHRNNKIIYCNKKALKYLGCCDIKQLRKFHIFDLIPEEYREISKSRLDKALQGKSVPFMEFPVLKIDEQKYVIYETKPVLFDYYGEKVCQIVIRDLSVQKKLIKETLRAEMAEKANQEILNEVKIRKQAEDTLKESLKEKELLIKEIHHRVKNNMQVMTSMLSLQSNSVQNENIKRALEESQNRIKSMALVHEHIYASTDFSNILFQDYFDSLTDNLLRSHEIIKKNIQIKKNIDPFYLPVTLSVPCGLIINEIISFSTKRFFVEISNKNCIFVEVKLKDNEVHMIISDNAPSFDKNKVQSENDSLSFLLINALIEQINGTLVIESNKETKFDIKFNI